MAFKTAAGYGNLPNGNFSPVIYSQKVQQAFRKSSVAESITNSDYFGEIANYGATVKIIKEPEITVKEYARGVQVSPQDLDDEDFSLVVDKANYFAFKVDDIEEAHSHVNFESLASDRAGYRLKDQHDMEVLGYLSGWTQGTISTVAGTANTTVSGTKAVSTAGNITTGSAGTHSVPLAARVPGATALPTATASPLMVIARMNRLLDTQFVDSDNRWLVVHPVFMEVLNDEDSRLFNADFGQSGGIRDGLSVGKLLGFDVYVSNNLPSVGTGPATTGSANQNSNYGIIVAGHSSAIASASQITKTESYRDPDSFADIVRGMHLYGRKILRPEAIVNCKYNVA